MSTLNNIANQLQTNTTLVPLSLIAQSPANGSATVPSDSTNNIISFSTTAGLANKASAIIQINSSDGSQIHHVKLSNNLKINQLPLSIPSSPAAANPSINSSPSLVLTPSTTTLTNNNPIQTVNINNNTNSNNNNNSTSTYGGFGEFFVFWIEYLKKKEKFDSIKSAHEYFSF